MIKFKNHRIELNLLAKNILHNLQKYNQTAYFFILRLQITKQDFYFKKEPSENNRMSHESSLSTTAFAVEVGDNRDSQHSSCRRIPAAHSNRGRNFNAASGYQESTNFAQNIFDKKSGIAIYSIAQHCYDTNVRHNSFSRKSRSERKKSQRSVPNSSHVNNVCLFSDDRAAGSRKQHFSDMDSRKKRETGGNVSDGIRYWYPTQMGIKLSKSNAWNYNGLVFTFMGYNVLAQDLLTEHSYLYRNHQPRALLWETRWKNLFQEIKNHNPDILCLQEVQENHLEKYYNEFRKLGYGGIFKKRTGARTDGCAFYYRKNMFKLIDHVNVEYFQPNISVLDRENVAIVAKLAPIMKPKLEFIVANTHLLYNPKRQDVRLAQTQVLLAEVERMAYSHIGVNGTTEYLPMIITGDFNSEPTSAVYELLANGDLHYEFLARRTLAKLDTTTKNNNSSGKVLIPARLRITDQCQHFDLLSHRTAGAKLSTAEQTSLIQIYSRNKKNQSNKKFQLLKNDTFFSSGRLTHNFDLKSAFSHQIGNDTEGTTYQDAWITVDYIFYSGTEDDKTESKLKLLSRYSIPTTRQLKQIKYIPNFVLGSDHLAIVTKFKLDF